MEHFRGNVIDEPSLGVYFKFLFRLFSIYDPVAAPYSLVLNHSPCPVSGNALQGIGQKGFFLYDAAASKRTAGR